MSETPQSREHYRLRYPVQARPRLTLGQSEFTITEISEQGCRVLGSLQQSLLFNDGPSVQFSLHDGKLVTSVVGLIRVDEDEVVLKLFEAIPLNVIIAEQQWVIRKFPR